MEEFEKVGVIATERFPELKQFWSGERLYQHMSTNRVGPILFKELPPGTELWVKKANTNVR